MGLINSAEGGPDNEIKDRLTPKKQLEFLSKSMGENKEVLDKDYKATMLDAMREILERLERLEKK